MTRRHFEFAAAAVRELHCNLHGHDECNRCATLEAYVRLFRRFGPRFDESRFRAACCTKPTPVGETILRAAQSMPPRRHHPRGKSMPPRRHHPRGNA